MSNFISKKKFKQEFMLSAGSEDIRIKHVKAEETSIIVELERKCSIKSLGILDSSGANVYRCAINKATKTIELKNVALKEGDSYSIVIEELSKGNKYIFKNQINKSNATDAADSDCALLSPAYLVTCEANLIKFKSPEKSLSLVDEETKGIQSVSIQSENDNIYTTELITLLKPGLYQILTGTTNIKTIRAMSNYIQIHDVSPLDIVIGEEASIKLIFNQEMPDDLNYKIYIEEVSTNKKFDCTFSQSPYSKDIFFGTFTAAQIDQYVVCIDINYDQTNKETIKSPYNIHSWNKQSVISKCTLDKNSVAVDDVGIVGMTLDTALTDDFSPVFLFRIDNDLTMKYAFSKSASVPTYIFFVYNGSSKSGLGTLSLLDEKHSSLFRVSGDFAIENSELVPSSCSPEKLTCQHYLLKLAFHLIHSSEFYRLQDVAFVHKESKHIVFGSIAGNNEAYVDDSNYDSFLLVNVSFYQTGDYFVFPRLKKTMCAQYLLDSQSDFTITVN